MGGSQPKQDVVTQTEKTAGTSEQQQSGSTTGTSNQLTGQTGTTTGTTTGATTQAVNIPDWLRPFVQQSVGTAGGALADYRQGVEGFQVPQATLDQLNATTRGDYLYGGAGQQPFIDAAVRAAQPGVFSAFGAAGRAGSGLERAQLDQTAVDAFARLYQGERSNQLSAAGQLPGLSMLPLQLQQQLATLSGNLPGQFAPFLGQSGTQTGTQTGATTGTGFTSGTTAGTMQGSQTGSTTGSSTGQTITPLHETPWWQTALGAGMLAAAPFTGGATLGGGASLLGGGGGGGGYASPYSGYGAYGGGGGSPQPFFTNPFTGGGLF